MMGFAAPPGLAQAGCGPGGAPAPTPPPCPHSPAPRAAGRFAGRCRRRGSPGGWRSAGEGKTPTMGGAAPGQYTHTFVLMHAHVCAHTHMLAHAHACTPTCSCRRILTDMYTCPTQACMCTRTRPLVSLHMRVDMLTHQGAGQGRGRRYLQGPRVLPDLVPDLPGRHKAAAGSFVTWESGATCGSSVAAAC